MNLRGSSLVFSLIVLSLLLVSALSVATVSITARKSSLSSKNSNVAFQVADSAAELMLKQIYKGSVANTPNDLASNLGTNCSASQIGASVGMGTYVATLYTADGSSISCSDSSWRDNVVKVKFQGKYQGTMRAIEVGITPPCNPVTDVDGNKYEVILIGTQCWMAENMMTTKYPNGSDITRGPTTSGGLWNGSDNGFYAYPPNESNNAEESFGNIKSKKLGFVYQWSVAMHGSTTPGDQGICPANWHVPTDAEYMTMEESLGMCTGTGTGCSGAAGWRGTNEGSKLSEYTSGGNNSSGFGAILAGFRSIDGSFALRSTVTYLWSSTPSGGSNAWNRYLFLGSTMVSRDMYAKAFGFSVRCLKD